MNKIIIFNEKTDEKINEQMNKKNKDKKIKKRVRTNKWDFSLENYEHVNQIQIISSILNNNFNSIDEISKIVIQEIYYKMNGYKQQDKIKKLFDASNFLNLKTIIEKMIECDLKCKYCRNEINVLYDISREMKQWSVDRINNNMGHNCDNFCLACLECNLKRRCKNDEKFLFTKQLKIVKHDL